MTLPDLSCLCANPTPYPTSDPIHRLPDGPLSRFHSPGTSPIASPHFSASPRIPSRVLLIVTMFIASSAVISANSLCRLPIVPNTDDGYRMRGNRCEGIYAREVATHSMVITSLTSNFDELPQRSTYRIRLSWPAGAHGTLHIAGRGHRYGAHYALDTVVDAATSTFSWPAQILIKRNFRRTNLGFLAWQESASNGNSTKHYLPLRVSLQSSPNDRPSDPDAVHTIAFRPGARFSRMYSTLERLCEGDVRTVFERTEIGLRYYSTEKVLYPITLSGPPGLYRLTIEPQRDDGVYSTPLVVSFWHGTETLDPSCDD